MFDCLGVELEAVSELASEHEAQLLNYLRIARQPGGYLVNFGHLAGSFYLGFAYGRWGAPALRRHPVAAQAEMRGSPAQAKDVITVLGTRKPVVEVGDFSRDLQSDGGGTGINTIRVAPMIVMLTNSFHFGG